MKLSFLISDGGPLLYHTVKRVNLVELDAPIVHPPSAHFGRIVFLHIFVLENDKDEDAKKERPGFTGSVHLKLETCDHLINGRDHRPTPPLRPTATAPPPHRRGITTTPPPPRRRLHEGVQMLTVRRVRPIACLSCINGFLRFFGEPMVTNGSREATLIRSIIRLVSTTVPCQQMRLESF